MQIDPTQFGRLIDGANRLIDLVEWFPTISKVLKDQATGGAGTIDDLEFDRVPEGQVWIVTSVCAIDKDSATATVSIGIKRQDEFLAFRQDVTPTANESVDFQGELLLVPGDKLCVRFTSATANDNLYAYANGYWIRKKSPLTPLVAPGEIPGQE